MPVSPHPITVTCNDADSNTQANVKVYLRNVTKGSNLEKDTD